MNKCWATLKRLEEVRLEGVAEECGHRTCNLEIFGGNWGAIGFLSDHDAAETGTQVGQA